MSQIDQDTENNPSTEDAARPHWPLIGPPPTWAETIKIAGWSLVGFGFLGTLTALWENPLFIRMTPIYGLDYGLLAGESLLLGAYLGFQGGACMVKRTSLAGIFGFLGFGCSICNKILLLLFGSTFLLTYFEPIRHWVGLAGLGVLAYVLSRKLSQRKAALGMAPSL